MISRLVNSALEEKNLNKTFYVFLFLHVILWAALPIFTRLSIDPAGDSLELFAWGQEWQWGYYKHPPLFAWVGTLWLYLTSISNWSFLLLSFVNIAVGFVAVFYLAKEFLSKRGALLSVLLLEFIVFYTFTDVKFNANAILISLVPLTALFAYYSVMRKKLIYWVLLGLFSGAALLGKYFAGVLLLSIFTSFLVSKEGRGVFKTWGPYIAAIIFFLVFSPHIIWLFDNDFMPILYPSKHIKLASIWYRIEQPVLLMRSIILFSLPLMLAYYFSTKDKGFYKAFYQVKNLSFKQIFPWAMFVLPILITLGLGAGLGVKLSTRWLKPWFCFLGFLLLYNYGRDLSLPSAKKILVSSFIFLIFVPILTLGVFYFNPKMLDIYSFPSKKMALSIEKKWQEQTSKPLDIVTGDYYMASCLTFYSKYHPSILIDYDFKISPWINKSNLKNVAVVMLGSIQITV